MSDSMLSPSASRPRLPLGGSPPLEPPTTAPPIPPSSTRRRYILALAGLTVVGLLVAATVRVLQLENRIEQLEERVPASVSPSGVDELAFAPDLFVPPPDLPALIELVGQSVVDIYCADGGGTGFSFGLGTTLSGFGTVLVTNYHVIEECWLDDVDVGVYIGEDLDIEVVGVITGVDEENDLALVEIERIIPPLPESPVFAVGGWWTMAMGNPYDEDIDAVLGRYVTFGHIGYVLDDYWNYTSATLNRGNSGGPLVNSRGELIGINTLASSGIESGVWNIAIDSDVLCETLVACE